MQLNFTFGTERKLLRKSDKLDEKCRAEIYGRRGDRPVMTRKPWCGWFPRRPHLKEYSCSNGFT